MTVKMALASLTPEQRQRLMVCFNDLEPLMILLEDEHFLSVHMQPDRPFEVIERSQFLLLGRFT